MKKKTLTMLENYKKQKDLKKRAEQRKEKKLEKERALKRLINEFVDDTLEEKYNSHMYGLATGILLLCGGTAMSLFKIGAHNLFSAILIVMALLSFQISKIFFKKRIVKEYGFE